MPGILASLELCKKICLPFCIKILGHSLEVNDSRNLFGYKYLYK